MLTNLSIIRRFRKLHTLILTRQLLLNVCEIFCFSTNSRLSILQSMQHVLQTDVYTMSKRRVHEALRELIAPPLKKTTLKAQLQCGLSERESQQYRKSHQTIGTAERIEAASIMEEALCIQESVSEPKSEESVTVRLEHVTDAMSLKARQPGTVADNSTAVTLYDLGTETSPSNQTQLRPKVPGFVQISCDRFSQPAFNTLPSMKSAQMTVHLAEDESCVEVSPALIMNICSAGDGGALHEDPVQNSSTARNPACDSGVKLTTVEKEAQLSEKTAIESVRRDNIAVSTHDETVDSSDNNSSSQPCMNTCYENPRRVKESPKSTCGRGSGDDGNDTCVASSLNAAESENVYLQSARSAPGQSSRKLLKRTQPVPSGPSKLPKQASLSATSKEEHPKKKTLPSSKTSKHCTVNPSSSTILSKQPKKNPCSLTEPSKLSKQNPPSSAELGKQSKQIPVSSTEPGKPSKPNQTAYTEASRLPKQRPSTSQSQQARPASIEQSRELKRSLSSSTEGSKQSATEAHKLSKQRPSSSTSPSKLPKPRQTVSTGANKLTKLSPPSSTENNQQSKQNPVPSTESSEQSKQEPPSSTESSTWPVQNPPLSTEACKLSKQRPLSSTETSKQMKQNSASSTDASRLPKQKLSSITQSKQVKPSQPASTEQSRQSKQNPPSSTESGKQSKLKPPSSTETSKPSKQNPASATEPSKPSKEIPPSSASSSKQSDQNRPTSTSSSTKQPVPNPPSSKSLRKQTKQNPASATSSKQSKRNPPSSTSSQKQSKQNPSSSTEPNKQSEQHMLSPAEPSKLSSQKLFPSAELYEQSKDNRTVPSGKQHKAKQTILPTQSLNQIVRIVRENVRTISTEVLSTNAASTVSSNNDTPGVDNSIKITGVGFSNTTKQEETGRAARAPSHSDLKHLKGNKGSDDLQNASTSGNQKSDSMDDGTADCDRSLEGILPLDIQEANVPSSASSGKAKKNSKKKKNSKQESTLQEERRQLLEALPQYIPENDSRMKKRKEVEVCSLSALFSGNFGDRPTAEKPKRPNYFVAVQITNQEIKDGLGEVLAAVEENSKRVKPAFIAVDLLHITLAVMHLPDEDAVEKAKAALDECNRQQQSVTSDAGVDNTLTFDVSGLGNFHSQVVFAKVAEGPALDRLTKVAESVRSCLADQNIGIVDRSVFKSHITIMKMSKNREQLRKAGVRKIAEDLYKTSISRHFGSQTVATIQLCSMLKEKQNNYYYIEYEVPFAVKKLPPTVGEEELPTVKEELPTVKEELPTVNEEPMTVKDAFSTVNEAPPNVKGSTTHCE